MNAAEINELGPLGVKLFTGGSSILLVGSSLYNVFVPIGFSTFVLSCQVGILSFIALACEFSPIGLDYLMKRLPWITEYRWRGFLYFLAGFFFFGEEMGTFARVAGSLMAVSGMANIALHYLLPSNEYQQTPQPSGFQEDALEPYGQI